MSDQDVRAGRDYEAQWHLDKKVPIAIIVTMAVQVMFFAWWGGGFSNRVDQLERQVMTLAPQTERIIRLETKVDAITGSLTEIKAMVRPRPP